MSRPALRWLGVAVLGVIWVTTAFLLWHSSKVPGSLQLPHVDTSKLYPAAEIHRARSYDNGVFLIFVAGLVAQLVAFVFYAWGGARFARESAAGPIGTGMLLGMLGFGLIWVVSVPFTALGVWWDHRHDVHDGGYWVAILGGWFALGLVFAGLCVALAIVMGFARWIGDSWWAAAAPCFVLLAAWFAFVLPYTQPTHRITDPQLRATVVQLQREEGVSAPVRIQDVSDQTSFPNAETEGLGPSRRVVIWDTLLDGRFSPGEVKVVLAHEFGHAKRGHIWKSLVWYALFAFPGAYLIARITRRRGGMGNPEAVPLSLLVLVVLTLLALPVENAISRHMEAEADWMALQTTRDPKDAKSLFQKFVPTTLQDPNPSLFEYLLAENHPTANQRIAMVEAWQERYATSDNQSP